MGKGKGGRGTRSGHHLQGGRREDHKQNLFDPTLDTEMLNVPHQSRKRYKKTQNTSVGLPSKLENSKQGRVGKAAKAAKDVSQKRQSVSSNIPKDQQPPFRAAPSHPAFSSENPFVGSSRLKSHRASIASCVSSLSTKIGRGPYCFRCARTNRKLRQALLDLLEHALKDGRKLIDEWAWEAGVSPDHMDCERTKMHTIPECLQSEDKPCHGHKREMADPTEIRHSSTFPPQTSQAFDMSGPQLPSAGIHQPSPPQSQQKWNPFFPAVSGTFESQTVPMLAAQVPNGKTWTLPNGMSVAEPTATYACYVGQPGRASPSRAQCSYDQQHQQDHPSSHVCQVGNVLSSDSTHRHLDPTLEQPAHVLEQATINSYFSNSTNQEYRGGHPLMLAPQMSNVEDPLSAQSQQAQQHPSQCQPQSLSSHFEYPSPIFFKELHDQDNSKITPPPSNEMTIRSMLNNGTGTAVGTSFESMQEGAEKSSGGVLDPDQEQEQTSNAAK
ncbi:hypothetical protein N0V82_007882 [Gnomoniopsis sp. IMI 355080]|nr:hypothetical protein N0V82_007882 [Gnomoniopsis sp. IMI 355080]